MIRFLRDLVFRNAGAKLFALAAAFGVWLIIASEPELATIISVPVQYSHYPQDLEISSDITESIDVEARGPAAQLRRLSGSATAAVIDFASVHSPGERTFTLTGKELRLPPGIELIRTIPGQLRFTFERWATRAIRIEVPLSGKMPDGYRVVKVDVQPATMQIRGPESHVFEAKKLVSDPFDLTGVATDTQQSLAVYAAEPEVRILTNPQVTVKVHVQRNR